MRRHKLISLEKSGLVQEGGSGYAMSFSGDGVGDLQGSGSALEDEKLRNYMLKKARDEAVSRERRMNRLRQLARMDFKMIGGVSPIGFYGGAGGSGAGGRPASMGNRT